MKQSFDLIPFAVNTAPDIEITGAIARDSNQLQFTYQLTYQLTGTSQITIPEPAPNPTRQYDLWEHTCIELFLQPQDSTQYWEFNLSPAGHWNVFRLPDYRQNIGEELAFDALPSAISQQADSLEIDLVVELDKIIAPEQKLKVGVTSVIEVYDGCLSYWALTHPGKEPDFHNQDSFILEL